LVSYDNPKAAEAYKDFLLNRYDRLVTMLTGIGRLDMLTANMAQFLDNLSYNDRLKVEKEVSETKKLC
jgi:hypothetical protein